MCFMRSLGLCSELQATQYVASALAPLVLGGHVKLGPLLASPCEGLMEGGKAAEFAVVAIKQVRSNYAMTTVKCFCCEGKREKNPTLQEARIRRDSNT